MVLKWGCVWFGREIERLWGRVVGRERVYGG